MKKAPKDSRPNKATWTSFQAYAMAAYSLALGVLLGYLFHGSASSGAVRADAASTKAVATNTAEQQFDPEQHKAIVDRTAAPLLEVLKNNPNDFETIVKVGNLYYDVKQYREAITYYKRGLVIQPQNVNVRTDMATAYWYLGEADQAIKGFEDSLRYEPNHPETLFNLGIVKWQGKNDVNGAIKVWQKLLDTNPNYEHKRDVEQFIAKAQQHTQG